MERSGLNTEQVHLLTQAKTWVKRDVNLSTSFDDLTLKNHNLRSNNERAFGSKMIYLTVNLC